MADLQAEACACGRKCGPGDCLVSLARLAEPTRLGEVLNRFAAESAMRVFAGPRFSSRYFVWGQGPPLVLGHGLSDSLESFLPLAHHLTDRFTCIAWDLPATRGEGLNRLPWIRHRDLADHLVALLRHLRLDKAHVMGCSFGSTVALDALYRYPAFFEKGILQGGFAHRPLSSIQRLLVRVARFVRRPVMRQMPKYEDFLRKGNGEGFETRDPAFWGYLVNSAGPTPVKTVCHQALWLDQVDFRPRLPDIRHPVLLVHGDRDKLVGPPCRETLKRGLINHQEVVLQGCGHVPCYTDTEALAAVIGQYLHR